MRKRGVFAGAVCLFAVMLTACQARPAGGGRLPRYSYEEMYGSDSEEEKEWDEDWEEGMQDLIDRYFSSEGGSDSDEWYYEGGLGDTMENIFFDFRVEEAHFVESYGGYSPQEDCELVDVTITLTNTFGEELPMFNSDFQIQWGGEGDDDYRFGLYELAEDNPEIMPKRYILEAGETVQYHLVYEVPAGYQEFSVSYLEVFADNTEGSVYFVYFEPDSRML